MRKGSRYTRRSIVGSLAAASLVSNPGLAQKTLAIDTTLVALGREFDEVAAQLDHIAECNLDLPGELDDRLGQVWDAIETTPATTLEGLQVKARLACWCLLGDLDTPEKATGDQQMAYAILRDLIRMHRPEMERPGALTKLVEEIENGAG